MDNNLNYDAMILLIIEKLIFIKSKNRLTSPFLSCRRATNALHTRLAKLTVRTL